jgi:predicted PhzF superfamily epimerase YddE/YHI9
MAICTAPGANHDIVSRVFVPAWGVDEDSVTGSAHAALAPFWAKRLGRDTMTAHQASTRGGDLALRLEGSGKDARAWLGGPCVTVVEGVFYLTG